MKNDAKFEEELTFRFKIDMKNLTIFDSSTHKSQNVHFSRLLLSKLKNVKFTEELCVMTMKNDGRF